MLIFQNFTCIGWLKIDIFHFSFSYALFFVFCGDSEAFLYRKNFKER